MSYIYKQEFADEFIVGFYAPDGLWHQDSKHKTREQAAERVHWLNGGTGWQQPISVTAAHTRAMEQLAQAIRNMPHTVRMRP